MSYEMRVLSKEEKRDEDPRLKGVERQGGMSGVAGPFGFAQDRLFDCAVRKVRDQIRSG